MLLLLPHAIVICTRLTKLSFVHPLERHTIKMNYRRSLYNEKKLRGKSLFKVPKLPNKIVKESKVPTKIGRKSST